MSLSLLKAAFLAIKNLLSFERFSPEVEKQYADYRYVNALPIMRFTMLMGGIFTISLSIASLLSEGIIAVTFERWLYILVWALLFILALRQTVNMYFAFCCYILISTVFFIYYRYFQVNLPIYIVPTVILLLMGLIVAQAGPTYSSFIGFMCSIIATVMFVATNEINLLTTHILIMMWFTSIVVWLASIILEHANRTRFRSQREAQIAQAQANEANLAKGEFIASMSHEIRTPLTAIIGYAQSIIEDELEAEQEKDGINRIHHNGNHLLNLVNDILDLSKIEQGKFSLLKNETNIFDLVRGVKFATENLAQKKGLDLVFAYKFPLPNTIIADSVRLHQILVNLVGNAIKFTEQGKVVLTVTAHEEILLFSIEDTGIGISKHAEKRIFESFEQGDAEITRRFGGTGLGLAIAKKLSVMMGGDLTFSSETGKGSVFVAKVKLELPEIVEWVNTPIFSPQIDFEKLSKQSFSGNVLLVDDVVDNRNLISMLLRQAGIAVDLAENGLQALEMIMVKDYDLVLMDIQMPVMDGIKAVQQLRSLGNQTPVIALTANVMEREVIQYLSIGFNGHLGKPINRPEFMKTLANFLSIEKNDPAKIGTSFEEEFLALQNQYIIRLQNQLSEIKQKLADKDWQNIEDIAHAIKGTSGSYSFQLVSQKAAELEQAARNKDQQISEVGLVMCEAIVAMNTDNTNT